MKVRIVAPSGKVNEQKVRAGVSYLKKFGFSFLMGQNLFREHGYFAGTDHQRLDDLQKALDSLSEDIIWIARGGYGLGRICDSLEWKEFITKPKWLIGYSDISLILFEILNRGFPCIHGPVLQSENQLNEEVCLVIKGIIEDKKYSISWESSKNDRQGIINGMICGGNLAMVCSAIGTRSEPNWSNYILFLEEVNEPFHKVDRMLSQLERAGILSRIKGLIVGEFPNFDSETVKERVEEMILEKTKDYSYPISFGFPGGHGEKNYPIPFGMELKYGVGKNNELLKIH